MRYQIVNISADILVAFRGNIGGSCRDSMNLGAYSLASPTSRRNVLYY